jgi:hypothetical protein
MADQLTSHHEDRLRDYLTGFIEGSHYHCNAEKLFDEGVRFAMKNRHNYGSKPFGAMVDMLANLAEELEREAR